MKLPPLTRELMWKVDNMHTLLDLDRLGGLAKIEGNPWRIEIKQFGRATAFISNGIPTTYYNKVVGFGTPEAHLLDQVAAFYIAHQAPTCRIDILPGEIDENLADRMSLYGLRHVDFQAGFYGLPDTTGLTFPPNVVIRQVETDEDIDTYLRIFHAGWEMQADTVDAYAQTMRFWRDIPDWHLYLALLDGVPRGVGQMFARDGVGYLAIATTLHEFRGKGCERALIIHATNHIRELGCELVCGQCEVSSPTVRNFERIGMRLAYHKAGWLLRAQTH